MLLLIDVGNTNVVFGITDNGQLIKKWRMSTNPSFTEDEYVAFLSPLMQENDLSSANIKGVIISTVVPRTLFPLSKLAEQYFNCNPVVVGGVGFRHDLKIMLDNPAELGADLLANSVAALKIYKQDMLVLDFGTATTFTIINNKREFIGGVIAPGINLSMQALKSSAAQLSEVMLAKPGRVIGKNTKSCMQSGMYFGYLSLIEGVIAKLKEEYANPIKVVATGGLANFFASGSNEINFIESDLTLIGLEYLYNLNKDN